jgi:uncharacterized damage-inducible protein DinB
MAETQRKPVPLDDSGELGTTLAFLNFARESVLKKTDGLDDEQLRRVLVDTGTTLIGLVQHLTGAERYWFGYTLAGDESQAEQDLDMVVTGDTEQILADYRAAIAASDEAVRKAGDPEARLAQPVNGNLLSVRWVIAHMTSETARHAGHADILREQIDGTTGR